MHLYNISLKVNRVIYVHSFLRVIRNFSPGVYNADPWDLTGMVLATDGPLIKFQGPDGMKVADTNASS
jgi:hypothetical protein